MTNGQVIDAALVLLGFFSVLAGLIVLLAWFLNRAAYRWEDRQALTPLLATSLGVWFISHTDTIQDGNRITYIPKIDKRVRTLIEGACDFCLLAEANGPNRQLHTTPSGRYQAGSRVPLPEPMPLDARTLYVEIAKGLIKPKAAAATTTSENTQDASTSPKEAVPA
jgi:hypothetical protein